MDLADDIAYSTYDLEDSFKGGFLSPIEMFGASEEFTLAIIDEINEKLKGEYPGEDDLLTLKQVEEIFQNSIFHSFFEDVDGAKRESMRDLVYRRTGELFCQSKTLAQDGYLRTDFTSKLVRMFMDGVVLKEEEIPCLSSVKFELRTFKMVEILKKFAYKSLIMSPRFKLAESRSKEIITAIFKTLMQEGNRLLPEDWRNIYTAKDHEKDASVKEIWQARTVCDFIACMTDRYCLEYYSRLTGIYAPSIHIPLF